MKWKKTILALFLLRMCVASIQAEADEVSYYNTQEEGKKPVELEEIVVTATRHKSYLRDAPSKVTVITKEEIEKSDASTVEDILSTIPEVNIVGGSTYLTMKRQLTLRGVPDQSRTLVMVDGIPMNSAYRGRVQWGMIPAKDIERIEIVYGPMSALYGSGAMGGVINIITQLPKKKCEGYLSTRYGTLDSWYTVFSQGGRIGKFAYSFCGHFFDTDGYIPEKEPASYDIKRGKKEWSASAKFAYFPDEESSLLFGLLHDDVDASFGRRYSNMDDNASIGYMTFKKSWDRAAMNMSFFVNDQLWNREFDQGPDYNYLNMVEDVDQRYIGGMLSVNFFIAENNTLSTGVDYKHGKMDVHDVYQTYTRTAGSKGWQNLASIFLQDEHRFLGGRLIFTGGLRTDYCKSYDGSSFDTGKTAGPGKVKPFFYRYDDRNWFAVSPKVSLLFHLREFTTLRASIGRAFNSPNLKELYPVLARPNRTVKGNPDLDPETLLSYELGFNHWFNDKVSLGLSTYYSQGKDFISQRTIDTKTFQYDNISKVKMWGVETELGFNIIEQLALSCGFTYNESTLEEDQTDPTLNGNLLALQPRHKASLKLVYDNPELFRANADLCYVGKMYSDNENTNELDGYFVFDLGISKAIGKYVELSLICQNLFDKKYDIPNVPKDDLEAPGRLVFISGTVKW